MSLECKLKPDRNITGILIPLSMIFLFGVASLAFGLTTGFIVLAAMLALFGLFYLYIVVRTGNLLHLFPAAEAVFFTYMFWMLSTRYDIGGWDQLQLISWKVAYLTGLVFFLVVVILLAVNRKLKWRGREIFELAADSVEVAGNGYTHRPCPVGKVEYRLEQLRGFARFAAKNLIALPYITSKNITLVPVKMGDEFGRVLGLSGDYRDASWVNFDVSGEVSVHISQKDYLDYREPLAFDQLCASLGQVFIDFFVLYCNGEGVRAVDRMDDLKIPIFS